jgi:hypothetical protein
MTIAIIILAYVASVFVTRWMNKLACKWDKEPDQIWIVIWFLPILNIAMFISILIGILLRHKPKIKVNWFTGKNW